LLKALASLTPALAFGRRFPSSDDLPIHNGPFKGTRESLQKYEIPKWYQDAKFGIWAHWGPQSGVEQGDWYARNMYIQGSDQYNYHVAHYGHPSKVGYKDLCPQWKAADWDPEHLIQLYKRAGAKYFMSMGVHHDNFDLWNSKHTRWNAVKVGPHRDVVGIWRAAALRHGLKFGVSEHLWISYKWFAVSHGSDQTGPLAGVSYDGRNPAFADLYHDAGCEQWSKDKTSDEFGWNDFGIPDAWKRHWFLRIQDLVNHYQPDVLYTDGPVPFENYGFSAVANLYNLNASLHGGQTQAVYTSKRPEDCAIGTCVLDYERGLPNTIRPSHWQTDTCIGEWHYSRPLYEKHGYKTPKTVIDMLIDIVSQNGNLLLNFPLPNNGQLDPDEMKILAAITDWMATNGEAIHGTRPWKIYGEGPSVVSAKPGGGFDEDSRKALTAGDVRFTTKDNVLYAFVMGWPEDDITVRALGTHSPQSPKKIAHVELLGAAGPLTWTQTPTRLRVSVPQQRPLDYAIALKITFA